MPHHARTAAWTSTATRRWLASCDVCRTWRLVADYYECYAPNGTGGGWWWSCGGCLLDVVDDLRAAVTQAAAGVTEADQCWHQQSWDAGEYDGDFHPGECFGVAICDDPCRLCLLTRVIEPDHDPDWDALPSPCTEHGMENCPCEEGAQYPPHDAAGERLGECRACHEADELGREHMERVRAAQQQIDVWIGDILAGHATYVEFVHLAAGRVLIDGKWLDLPIATAGQVLHRQPVRWDHTGGHPYENTLVDTPEVASAAAQAHVEGMSGRPQPGQALRHGAPCFLDGEGHKAEHDQAHVVGTHPVCSACVRYRNHLDISFEQAQRIALEGLHERADPTHSCLACSWGR